MSRKIITMAMKNEIIAMTKNGCTIREICEAVDISKPTVSRIRKEAGLSNMNDKGGKIARTIPLYEIEKNASATKCTETTDEACPPVVIAEQAIAICGTETGTVYKAETRKDTISIDGPIVIGEIKLDQIMGLVNELRGVHNLVSQMKGNRFGLMQ